MDDLVEKYSMLSRAMNAAADEMERHVHKLRRDAQSYVDRANWYRRLDNRLGYAPHLVNQLIAEGSDDPINDAASMLDAFPAAVEHHYEDFNRKLKHRHRKQRNRAIARMARDGFKTDQIARRHKVSERTVARVIKEADLGKYAKPYRMPERKLKPPGD